MIKPDSSNWRHLGDSPNARLFEVEPRVLAIDPAQGSSDTLETAQANLALGNTYFRGCGGGVVLVYFDLLGSQDREARVTYRNADPKLVYGLGLVGGSLLARAMMSFFLGLNRLPQVPTVVFGSTMDALDWSRAQIARRDQQAATNG